MGPHEVHYQGSDAQWRAAADGGLCYRFAMGAQQGWPGNSQLEGSEPYQSQDRDQMALKLQPEYTDVDLILAFAEMEHFR